MNIKSAYKHETPPKTRHYGNYQMSHSSSKRSLETVESQKNLYSNTKLIRRNDSPKLPMSPIQSPHKQMRPKRKNRMQEQLSTLNQLKKDDIQFQEMVILDKQLEYELYMTGNQIQQLTQSMDSMMRPLRVLKEQIAIWKRVVDRKNSAIIGRCSIIASPVDPKDTETISQIQTEALEDEREFNQKAQRNLALMDEQINSTRLEIDSQTIVKTGMEIQIFDLQESIPQRLQERINMQKVKRRRKLGLQEQREKTKIYEIQKGQKAMIQKELESIQQVIMKTLRVHQIHEQGIECISQSIIQSQRVRARQQLEKRKQREQEEAAQIPLIKEDIIKAKKKNLALKEKSKKVNNTLYSVKSAEYKIRQQEKKQNFQGF